MGLFGDLPSAKDSGEANGATTTPGKNGVGGENNSSKPDGGTVAVATSKTPGGGWSGAGSTLRAPPRKPPAALLNPQMLKAQAAALRAQQAKLARQNEGKGQGSGSGVASTSPSTSVKTTPTSAVKTPVAATGLAAAVVEVAPSGTLSADVKEEYVPSAPNSYEDVLRERAKKKT